MKTIPSAVLSAAAVAAVLVVATASGQSGTAPATTLKFVQVDHRFIYVDQPPKGGERKPPSQGDAFVIGGVLKSGGASVGKSNLVCTVTEPGAKGATNCTGVLVVPEGTIAIAGYSQLASDDDTFAVTGGTGKYASAHGTLLGTTGKNETTNLTVTLTS